MNKLNVLIIYLFIIGKFLIQLEAKEIVINKNISSCLLKCKDDHMVKVFFIFKF